MPSDGVIDEYYEEKHLISEFQKYSSEDSSTRQQSAPQAENNNLVFLEKPQLPQPTTMRGLPISPISPSQAFKRYGMIFP